MPIGGSAINVIALVVAAIAIFTFSRGVKKFEKEFQAEIAKAEREQAEIRAELGKAPAEVRGGTNAQSVTAIQFYRDWEASDEQFDRAYKNRIIELTGTFVEIDFSGESYAVILRGPNLDDSVDCLFAKDPAVRAQLAQLTPGSQVRIRGKCLGNGPTLEACILLP